MKALYFDCFAGVSGDMTVAAMISLGLPIEHLKQQLALLNLPEFKIEAGEVNRSGLKATKFDVADISGSTKSNTWAEIRRLIESADGLSDAVRNTSIKIFSELAAAEAAVHGVEIDSVHFHEVGALDSIIDIVAAAIGYEWLGSPKIICSPLPLSRGFVETAHGRLPLPAPAVVELLNGLPTTSSPEFFETVTPTGAAIVKALAGEFGPTPPMNISGSGYGAGTKIGEHSPNLLRLIVGEIEERDQADVLIEASIDDMNPEFYDHLLEKLFEAGARDVFLRSIQMKKNRPAEELVVITSSALREAISEIIFRESTTIGLRYYPIEREVLDRRTVEVSLPGGPVRLKIGEKDGRIMNVAPEYEDLRRIAKKNGEPIKQLHQAALAAFSGGEDK